MLPNGFILTLSPLRAGFPARRKSLWHPIDASEITCKSHSSSRSVYVPLTRVIAVHGKEVHVKGGIKSLDPPCLEDALSFGDYPYTCTNCANQLRQLKDILRHREVGSWSPVLTPLSLTILIYRRIGLIVLSVAMSQQMSQCLPFRILLVSLPVSCITTCKRGRFSQFNLIPTFPNCSRLAGE